MSISPVLPAPIIQRMEAKIADFASSHEFKTFWLGITLSSAMEEKFGKEERDKLKTELKRELGRKLEAAWKKQKRKAVHDDPDIVFTLDFHSLKLRTEIKPLYIYGRYRKFSREIPQSKWPCVRCGGRGCAHCGGKGAMYEITVEGLVAEPLLKATGARETKIHCVGREDVDARMLGTGRPFIIELSHPAKRSVDLGKMAREINKKNKKLISVSRLSFVGKDEVQDVKAAQPDKKYSVTVECDTEVTTQNLKSIRDLAGSTISQRTPERVLHRRGDLERKKKVNSLSVTRISPSSFLLKLKVEAGTYVKEFVSGDNGRTKPSVSGVLGCACTPKDLDVSGVGFQLSARRSQRTL